MKWIFFIATIILFCSCEKQIPYNASSFDKKLVVNASLESGKNIEVLVSESVNPVQVPNINGLNGELVYLLREDSVVIDYQAINLNSGRFIINKIPRLGKKYELELAMDEYPPVKMTDTVPAEFPIFDIDTLFTQDNDYKLSIKINDQLSKQIYMITMRAHGTQINGNDTFATNYSVAFLSNDKVFLKNINNASTSGSFGLFDDKLFNGNTKLIDVEFENSQLAIAGFNPKFIEVKLANISNTMYNYYVGLLENNHIYGGPLATYTLSTGNVQDGLGLFAFYNATIKTYAIP